MAIIGGRAHNLQQVVEVGRLGYPFAEINLDDPAETARRLDDLLALKEKYGLYYLAHYPNEGDPFDPEKLRDRFVPRIKRLLALSRELGIEKATIHFWMDRRWAPEGLLAAKTALLAEMVEEAARQGVVLCIENLTEQFESFAALFEQIPALRMTLDIGHGELLSTRNTAFDFIHHLFPRIGHVHVHDNHGGKTVKDDLHLPLGDGRVDYPGILSLLNEKGYASTITMEVSPEAMPRTRREILRYMA